MDLDTAMRQAIDVCREGIRNGQDPFGAVILRDGKPIAVAHNTVARDHDPTAHAEVNAIRAATQSLGSADLSGCTLVSTCEPCPMCLAASYWAGIESIHFGASIRDAEAAGFDQIRMPASTLAHAGARPMPVEGGRLRDDCLTLFREWKARS